MVTLYNGDCLIELTKIADKSVDLILTDLPYGTTACKWDTIIPLDKLWVQYNRVIKDKPVYNPQMWQSTPYSGFKNHDKKIGEVYGSIGSQHRDNPTGERYPKSVLRFKQEKGFHPTQKPVKMMEYLIKTYTNEGDTVLDSTMGSGTTGVATINTNRNFIGIEMDTNYFEISQSRINKAQNTN